MAETEGQEIAIIAVSRNGAVLGARLRELLVGSDLYVSAKLARHAADGQARLFEGSVAAALRDIFPKYRKLVLFVALGAAVRLLAPLLKDKRTDPAVVVVDDQGKHAISALSGHLGGANDLARRVAALIGAQPVITTASDMLGTFSPDLIGQDYGWVIENEENLTKVSAALVNGEPVGLFQDAGERGWWPADKRWPKNVKVFGDLAALAESSCAAALLITDSLLDEECRGLLEKSVVYRPKSLVLGVGCNRGVTASEIEDAVLSVLNEYSLSMNSVKNLATIDIKSSEEGLLEFVRSYGLPIVYFTGAELNAVRDIPNPSDAIYRTVGTRGVCEPAAMLSAKTDRLLMPKRKIGNATIAIARTSFDSTSAFSEPGEPGAIFVVGLGPGATEHMTFRAREALAASEVVVGYKTYLGLISDLLAGKEVIGLGMQQEVARAKRAIEVAEAGRNVAVVSSGDAGIYGMAGLIYEVARARGWTSLRNIEVVPGVSALNAAAALLGAPLMHDFAAISLSDLLTPWGTIARRLKAAAEGDFVVVLYNPKSGRRTQPVEEARRIILMHRRKTVPVGLVTSAYRRGQNVVITDLEHMLDFDIGMLTTVIVGNSETTSFEDVMVTSRGYDSKYELGCPASGDDA